jgi:hypothetical protein
MHRTVWTVASLALPCIATPLMGQTVATDDEVRATVAEMLADAQGRSSLLAGGAAGHDGGFFLASDDGDFRLNVTGFIQFRYDMSFRDEDNTIGAAPGDDFSSGFQMRRMKLGFAGKVYKSWSYNVLMNFSRSTGDAQLQDAYVEYAINGSWSLKMGQAKLPLLREELVGDQRQLTVERSLVNSAFTQDRSQMVELGYSSDTINFRAAFSDGLNSDNTDYPGDVNNGFIVAGAADWAATARLEYILSGTPKQFADFTSPAGGPFGAMLGAAIHYQQSPNTNDPADTDRDTLEYTADLSLEGSGWNGFVEFVGRNDGFRAGGSSSEFDDFGVVAQAGFRVAETWEPFARYEVFFFDSDRGLAEETHHFVTLGVNKYYAGHAAKLTADAVIAIDDTSDLVSLGILRDTGVGLLGDSEGSEVVVRLQFQLLF